LILVLLRLPIRLGTPCRSCFGLRWQFGHHCLLGCHLSLRGKRLHARRVGHPCGVKGIDLSYPSQQHCCWISGTSQTPSHQHICLSLFWQRPQSCCSMCLDLRILRQESLHLRIWWLLVLCLLEMKRYGLRNRLVLIVLPCKRLHSFQILWHYFDIKTTSSSTSA